MKYLRAATPLLLLCSMIAQPIGAQQPGGLTMNVLHLDGRNAHVQLPPNIFDTYAQSTIETWARFDAFNKWCRVFDFGREGNAAVLQTEKTSSTLNFSIYDRKSGRHRIQVKNRIRKGGWYHLAVSSGPEGMRFYINGELVGEDGYTGSLDAVAGGNNFIGKSNWPKDQLFEGYIAEFRVWDHQRSQEQIQASMKQLLTGRENGLIAYWHFNASEGSSVSGKGPSGRVATLRGNAEIVSVPAISQYLVPGEMAKVAEQHLQSGKDALSSQNYKKAAEEFQEALKNVFPYKDASELAAEALYKHGVDLLRQEEYRSAVHALRKCQSYVAGYLDAADLERNARPKAIQRVAVMPFDNLSGRTDYGQLGIILSDMIIGQAFNAKGEFLELVTRDQLEQVLQEQKIGRTGLIDANSAAEIGKLVGVQAFVFGKLQSITVHSPPPSQVPGQSSKTIKVDGDKRRVTAYYTDNTQQRMVEIRASFQIVEVKRGTIRDSGTLVERVDDGVQWRQFTSGRLEAYQSKGEQRPLNPPQMMVNEAMDAIAAPIASRLIQYFD